MKYYSRFTVQKLTGFLHETNMQKLTCSNSQYSHPGLNPNTKLDMQLFHPGTTLFFCFFFFNFKSRRSTIYYSCFFPITPKLRLFSDNFALPTSMLSI